MDAVLFVETSAVQRGRTIGFGFNSLQWNMTRPARRTLGICVMWLWVKTNGTTLGFSVNSPPILILEPISMVGLNRMFTLGVITGF